MLHITDIEKRLSENPEPQFVTDVRQNIISFFGKLEFQEGPHKYFVHNDDGSVYELPSVSATTHQFSPFVDWDAICIKKAQKEGVDPKDLKMQWRKTNIRATSNGTRTHLFGEAMMWYVLGMPEKMPEDIKQYQYEDGFLIPYGKKEEAISSFYEDMIKIPNMYPVMPEAQVYIKNEMGLSQPYAGTFDMLFAYKMKNGEFKLAIFDWKTNESLENSFNRSKHKTLLKPFDSMIDESLSLYTLQLSAYQLAISQLNYDIVDRRVVWLKSDGTYEKIAVNDESERLKLALSD